MKMTTLCYIEKDGQYLMLHRTKKKKDINKDKWIGVGGHAEGAESPEDCLLREVKEETGLTLTSFCFRGLITFVSDANRSRCVCLRQTALKVKSVRVTRANLHGLIRKRF